MVHRFSAGRGTALIVDIGKSTASVTPVVDGFVLRKGMLPPSFLVPVLTMKLNLGISHSSIPSLVQNTAQNLLANPFDTRPGIDLLPYQFIDKKTVCALLSSTIPRLSNPRSFLQPVEINRPPNCILRDERLQKSTISWRQWAAQKEVDEWMMACGGLLPKGWSEEYVGPHNCANPLFIYSAVKREPILSKHTSSQRVSAQYLGLKGSFLVTPTLHMHIFRSAPPFLLQSPS